MANLERRLNIQPLENSYSLSGEIPLALLRVDSIGHTGEIEHQTGEAGLNGVKALTTKK